MVWGGLAQLFEHRRKRVASKNWGALHSDDAVCFGDV